MDWAYLFEISLTGIAGGGLYALAALAFVIVYKATRVVNIAIGEMLMAGAYLFFTFASMFALPLWLAIPAAVLGAAGSKGEAIRASLRRRWSTIEACEASPAGRLRGAAAAARSAAAKLASRKKTPARVAHA